MSDLNEIYMLAKIKNQGSLLIFLYHFTPGFKCFYFLYNSFIKVQLKFNFSFHQVVTVVAEILRV